MLQAMSELTMRTNNEIVMEYYPFCQQLRKKIGVDEDCLQICLLALLQMDNEKLNGLAKRKQLKFWIARIFTNQ